MNMISCNLLPQKKQVIDSLETIFSRHGLPRTIPSDCCPQYLSSQFQNFCRENDAEQKGKSKIYADNRRRAEHSDMDIGDQVLLKQDKNRQVHNNLQHCDQYRGKQCGCSISNWSQVSQQYNIHEEL